MNFFEENGRTLVMEGESRKVTEKILAKYKLAPNDVTIVDYNILEGLGRGVRYLDTCIASLINMKIKSQEKEIRKLSEELRNMPNALNSNWKPNKQNYVNGGVKKRTRKWPKRKRK